MAATAFTVVGGVLSAQAARPAAPDTVAVPSTINEAPREPVAPIAPTTAPDDRPRPPSRAAALVAHRTARLGAVVADAEGFTLYRFDQDSTGDATCVDACAGTWPPATVDPDARLALEGVDTSEVGLIRRRDGTYQLTINKWPVYRFAGDPQPGTFVGHGIAGSWFAVTPTGAKAAPP